MVVNDNDEEIVFLTSQHCPFSFSADLCKLCTKHNLVFPALECFEERLDNPNAYFLFYDNFLRAVEGEEKWKVSATKSTNDVPLSSHYNEAFALIFLKNNYFAWLLDAKQTHVGLITDYDYDEATSSSVKNTLTEYLMGGICVENNVGFHTVLTPKPHPQPMTDGGGEPTESDEEETSMEDEEYERAADYFKKKTEELRERVRDSLDYQKIKNLLGGASYDNDEKSRKKKMRKIMKGLKQYTGARVGEEKAYRGWSERTHKDMLNYMKVMQNETRTRYKNFEEEYRHVYAMRKEYNPDGGEDGGDSGEDQGDKETYDALFQIPEEFR